MFSGVQYSTGQFFDIKAITDVAHSVGALAGFDLAHAAGNVPLSLHDWDCDFACWCTYKYLNSGPGCIGGCFVHEKNSQVSRRDDGSYAYVNRFSGWWGHRLEDRFDMDPEFIPIPGAYGFRLSNPPVVCVACVRASLDMFDKAGGMPVLREKSLKLTGYLEHLLRSELAADVAIFTPTNPAERGCQLSLTFNKGNIDDIFNRLKDMGVVCDKRKPNIMRIAPTPLYNSFSDVCEFVRVLKGIMASIE
jgi:kynureninase